PNLVVNGASGIAVGMATNIAPHNLIEVVQALRHQIEHPEADLDDVMRFVPGPDLPTGGKIIGLDGIRDAYQTGRGSFRMRATARIENVTPRRKGIVVTELPYSVGTEKVVERIKSLVQAKKLQGVADIKDLTDRAKGLRLVIEVKNGLVPEALLEQLYKLTPMEDSFGINAVALVDGQPRTLGLKDLLEVFLSHRRDVVRRRSTHRRGQAADRLHLVEGLLIAILDLDEVIQLIRTSDDPPTARERLRQVFDLSDVQATHILDLPLRRLTRLARIELEREQQTLSETIGELDALLADPNVLDRTVAEELAHTAAEHGTPRRTVLLESAGQPVTADTPLEVTDDPCLVLVGATGLLARTSSAEPPGQGGGRSRHDTVLSVVSATSRGHVGVVTSTGRLHRLAVIDLPTLPATAHAPNLQGGSPIAEFLALGPGERVLCLAGLDPAGAGLALGTARGLVKRVQPQLLTHRDNWDVIRLDDGDQLVGAVELVSPEAELVFVTTDAQLLHFPADSVRPQGRAGGGVAGVRLATGAAALWFGTVTDPDGAVVVTVAGAGTALPGTEAGTAKVTPFADFPGKGRATGGVRCHRFLRGEQRLLLAWAGAGPARAAAHSGAAIDLPAEPGRRDGSGTPLAQPVAAVAGPVLGTVRG
ncbi:MAG: DNA topoisomerase IV, partial [Nocardioidaceae bacterium]|nr:DNA topoisomerase IV [Nocardioidaceae bacterium]